MISLGKPDAISVTALAVSGHYLFAAVQNNSNDVGSLREVDVATGRILKTISGKHYKFSTPVSLTADGPGLFVDTVNENDTSGGATSVVTEVDVHTGQLGRVLPGAADHIGEAVEVLADGPYVFVADQGPVTLEDDNVSYGPGSLAQIDAKTGAMVRVISGPRYDMSGATAMVVLGHNLYVADAETNAITEITRSPERWSKC